MDKDIKVAKISITELELLTIPDCRFKSEMMEILEAGGKVSLKLKVPSDFLAAKNTGRSARAKCDWWQVLWCK